MLKTGQLINVISLLIVPLLLNAETNPEAELDVINQKYLQDDAYQDAEAYPNLAEKLEAYKQQFIVQDADNSGDIDIMELKGWMVALQQTKTTLELKKMISEVDKDNTGSVSYDEFVLMRLGKTNSIFKLILNFEDRKKEKPSRPTL